MLRWPGLAARVALAGPAAWAGPAAQAGPAGRVGPAAAPAAPAAPARVAAPRPGRPPRCNSKRSCSEIVPSGEGAKIGSLLRAGGFTQVFKALEDSVATTQWLELPSGGHAAGDAGKHKPKPPKPVLVAAGHVVLATAGTANMHIRLTQSGRQLLKHEKRLRLTAEGSFAPALDGTVIKQARAFTLAR